MLHVQVRNKNRFEELRALGADEVIDVTEEDVVARVKAITGACEQPSLPARPSVMLLEAVICPGSP